MQLNREAIENSERKWRLNLINSIPGIKSANLIGTRSTKGENNVAVFSSVVHLGSNPAQLGFVMRPITGAPRHTFQNIQETGFYTINHISESMVKRAHYTSAKLEKSESEFDRMNLDKVFIDDFQAPFVRDSAVKIGMKHVESIPLPNGCLFIIGSVELLVFPDQAINERGQLDLSQYKAVGISGLNTYYSLRKKDTFPYVRKDEIPEFD